MEANECGAILANVSDFVVWAGALRFIGEIRDGYI